MPAICLVCGATKASKVKLHHFAVITAKTGQMHELSKRRRHEWLRVIKKTEEDLKKLRTGLYICSRHFKSGEPAKLQDVKNVDWIPSQFLAPLVNIPSNLAYKYNTKSRTQKTSDNLKTPVDSANVTTRTPPVQESKVQQPINSGNPPPNTTNLNNDNEHIIMQMKWALAQKELLIHNLQMKLRRHQLDESSFVNDDLMTQFYTGFATYKCFAAFVCTVENLLTHINFPGISTHKILIMVMTKLRLNLPIAYMSLKFDIPLETLADMFTSSVRILSDNLQVSWPIVKKTPQFLKAIFGDQFAAVADIFEWELDFGMGTFQTLKFLIVYSPCGRVSFVSKPFPGTSNDYMIINNSGLLVQLKPNNIILSLRSTLNQNIVAPGGCRDQVYVYAIGDHGLVRLDFNYTMSIRLKRNLQAVLDQVTSIFGFLGHKQPEMYMVDPVPFLSKAVMLCAALRNLILPI